MKMNKIVLEMYEDFIMSEACSNFYSLAGDDTEAQDWTFYFRMCDHVSLCQKGAQVCKDYLKSKDVGKLLLEFKLLGLQENILVIKEYLLLTNDR